MPGPDLRRKDVSQYLKDVQFDRRIEGRRGGGGAAAVFAVSIIQNRRGGFLLLLEHGIDLVVEIERADPDAGDGLGLADSTDPICNMQSKKGSVNSTCTVRSRHNNFVCGLVHTFSRRTFGLVDVARRPRPIDEDHRRGGGERNAHPASPIGAAKDGRLAPLEPVDHRLSRVASRLARQELPVPPP